MEITKRDWGLVIAAIPVYGLFTSICYLFTYWYICFSINPFQFADFSNVVFGSTIPIFGASIILVSYYALTSILETSKSELVGADNPLVKKTKWGLKSDEVLDQLFDETEAKLANPDFDKSQFETAFNEIKHRMNKEQLNSYRWLSGMMIFTIIFSVDVFLYFQTWFVFNFFVLPVVAMFSAIHIAVATKTTTKAWAPAFPFIMILIPLLALSQGLSDGQAVRKGRHYSYILAEELTPKPKQFKADDKLKFLGMLGDKFFYVTLKNQPLIISDKSAKLEFIFRMESDQH